MPSAPAPIACRTVPHRAPQNRGSEAAAGHGQDGGRSGFPGRVRGHMLYCENMSHKWSLRLLSRRLRGPPSQKQNTVLESVSEPHPAGCDWGTDLRSHPTCVKHPNSSDPAPQVWTENPLPRVGMGQKYCPGRPPPVASPVWVRTCRFRSKVSLKPLPQKVHRCRFTWLWHLRWRLSMRCKRKPLPQSSQLCIAESLHVPVVNWNREGP